MNEQLSLFGSGSVVDVSHSKQYQKKDDHYNGDTECEHNKWKWERAVWKGDKNEEH